jgi:hypothetical protein
MIDLDTSSSTIAVPLRGLRLVTAAWCHRERWRVKESSTEKSKDFVAAMFRFY